MQTTTVLVSSPVSGQAGLRARCVQSRVGELAAEEGRCEGFRAGEVLVGHVLLGGRRLSVIHRRGRVQGVADLQGVLRLAQLFSFRREGTRHYILLLHCAHVILNSAICQSVDFAFLTHLSEDLVLVGSLRILQRKVSLALHQSIQSQSIG